MKKFLLLFLFFFSFLGFSQTQIGGDIDGIGSNWEMAATVATSADGTVVAMGSSSILARRVIVYRNVSGNWTKIGSDITGNDGFGKSISLSANGSIIAVGDHIGNNVKVYRNNSGSWVQLGNTIPYFGEQTGYNVSLSADGNTVAIGSPYADNSPYTDNGQVRVFQNIAGEWTLVGGPIYGKENGDISGFKVALSADASVVAIGSPYSGANGVKSGQVRLFKNVSGIWTQIGADINGEAAGDESGWGLSLSADGNTVAIGAHRNDDAGQNSGHVRVYQNNSGTWTKIGQDIDGQSAGNQSGWAVSLSGDGKIVAIGSPYYGSSTILSIGHVRIFRFAGNQWYRMGRTIQGEAYTDSSGSSLALSSDGSTVVIGAPFNNGNGLNNCGHMRVFSLAGLISANDECANAMTLTPDAFCVIDGVFFNGTFKGSTLSGAAPSCAPQTIRDVWFKFTATTPTMGLKAWIEVGDPAFEIYEGSCSGSIIACKNTIGQDTEEYIANFTVGQEYFVRFFETDPIDNERNFPICLKSYQAPANDLCANATVLTPSTSCTSVSGSFVGSTSSGGSVSCANNVRQDVWYKFTATDTTMSIELTAALGNPAFVIYQGDCSGTIVACDNSQNGTSESYSGTNFIIGQQYYIRVIESALEYAAHTFTICLRGPSPACTPSVVITASAAAVCPGETVTFIAAPVNEGTAPSYQWKLNGNNVGANTPYYSAILSAPATVSVVMTSNATCASTTTAVSNTMQISITNPIIPAFTQIGEICSGTSFTLPIRSNDGILGSWSPAVNNTNTTTYTFVPVTGQCAATTTMTVTVNQKTVPAFTAVAPICTGSALTALPTTSNNGITGTWSPALNNTATTTYTFTPAASQCATPTTMSIAVNSNVTPSFTQVAAICSGGNLSALPTTSNNGIIGTWSPALNNTATTTYTFTPAAGQCATATATTMSIVVNQKTVPVFNQVAAICSGSTLVLPTTSTNGVQGSWSPALNNTATTTYTFTPANGICAETATMTVAVNQRVVPVFNPIAPICAGATAPILPATSTNGISGTWSPATINNATTSSYTFTPNAGQCAQVSSNMTVVVLDTNADIIVEGSTIMAGQQGAVYQWFNCSNGNTPIVGATGQSYTATANGQYAVSVTFNGCTKMSNCVTVSTLAVDSQDAQQLIIYPNPVSGLLFIKSPATIQSVRLYDISGKKLPVNSFTNETLDVSHLQNGVYFIELFSEGRNQTMKFVKN